MKNWERKCLQEYRAISQQLVKDALHEKERQFSQMHSADTQEQLCAYLRQCAKKLGYTPHPVEVIGSSVMIQRFTSWDNAIKLAGLKPIQETKDPPLLTLTKLYRDEWNEQWLAFKRAKQQEINRQASILARAKRNTKSADNKLKKALSAPERRRKEQDFAILHADDTDRQLYDYLKGERRRLGSQLKPISTIGYCYITRRLGPWHKVIGKVNRELKEEQQETDK